MKCRLHPLTRLALALAATGLCASGCSDPEFGSTGRAPAPDVGWPHYGNDAGGSRYSQLSQVTRDNVRHLQVAWQFRTGDLGDGFAAQDKMAYEATPVLYRGRLYLSTPFGKVFAIDAATGEEVWRFDAAINPATRYAEGASRGVTMWEDLAAVLDQPCHATVFQGTLDGRLIALDATTGSRCPDFGHRGEIDLTEGVRLKDPNDYTITSPVAVLGDSVIVGSAIGDNRMVEVERGIVRAFDSRSGELRWSWDRFRLDRTTRFGSNGTKTPHGAPAPRTPGPFCPSTNGEALCSFRLPHLVLISLAACVREITPTPTLWWPSTVATAKSCGIGNSSTTTCGIMTCRRSRCWLTSRRTV